MESRVEVKVRKDSVQVKPTREKFAGRFLFSDRKRKENALLRLDLTLKWMRTRG